MISLSFRGAILLTRRRSAEEVDVNKIDRPNMTPTVRAISTFAVFVASLLFMKGISSCVKRRKLEPLDPAKAYCKRS